MSPIVQPYRDPDWYTSEASDGGTWHLEPTHGGAYRVKISVYATKAISEMRRSLEELIRGRPINHPGLTPRVLQHLPSRDGVILMRKIQHETETYIILDRHSLTLRICGSEEKIATAEQELVRSLLAYHKRQQLEILLRGPHLRPDLMKEVVNRFGPELQGIKEKVYGVDLKLNTRYHVIQVHGSVEMRQEVEKIVYELAQEVSEPGGKPDDIEVECPICLCKVDDGYSLEGCSHLFCKACLLEQFEVSMRNFDAFPILCSHTDCGAPIVLADMRALLSQEKLDELFRVSLSSFVTTSDGNLRFCSTPDCHSVYRVAATPEWIVRHKLLDKKELQKLDDLKKFRLVLLVLVEGVVCPKGNTDSTGSVRPHVVEMLRDVDQFLKFPWGRESFLRTVKSIKSQSPYSIFQQKSISVAGFSHAITIVAACNCPALIGLPSQLNDEEKILSVCGMKLNVSRYSARNLHMAGTEIVNSLLVKNRDESLGFEDVTDPKVETLLGLIEDNDTFELNTWTGGLTEEELVNPSSPILLDDAEQSHQDDDEMQIEADANERRRKRPTVANLASRMEISNDSLKGEVEALKAEVEALKGEGEVHALKGEVEALKAELKAMKGEGEVHGLKDEVEALKAELKAMKGELRDLSGLRSPFASDSPHPSPRQNEEQTQTSNEEETDKTSSEDIHNGGKELKEGENAKREVALRKAAAKSRGKKKKATEEERGREEEERGREEEENAKGEVVLKDKKAVVPTRTSKRLRHQDP
ncbi:hypothetical protein Bca4012_083893 [Brassica carinata]